MHISPATDIVKQPTKTEHKKGIHVLPPVSKIQKVADGVSKWTKENDLEIHPTKT